MRDQEANEPLLKAEALRVSGQGHYPIELSLKPGDRVGLWSADQASTTSLLRTLARLDRPAAGRLYWDGVDLSRKPRWRFGKVRDNVRMVWANPYVLFEDRARVRDVLQGAAADRGNLAAHAQNYGLTPAVLDTSVQTLSALTRIRLALAYLPQPHVLLVDDVFHHIVREVWSSLMRMLDRRMTDGALLVASQFAGPLSHLDQIYVLMAGDIVEWGPRDVVLQHPEHAYTQWLTQRETSRRATTTRWAGAPIEVTTGHLVEIAPGHWVRR